MLRRDLRTLDLLREVENRIAFIGVKCSPFHTPKVIVLPKGPGIELELRYEATSEVYFVVRIMPLLIVPGHLRILSPDKLRDACSCGRSNSSQTETRFSRQALASQATLPGKCSVKSRLIVAELPRSFPLESDALPSIYHPYRWCMEGDMAQIIHQLRPKPADSEKITINLGYVDLGQIDLMVQEGFYSNRTDFIRSAIRNQLERHADVVKQSALRKSLDLGLRHYSRDDLEAARRAGEMLQIHVLGLASIALDVTPELARATIASVVVLGSLHASPAVKDALADRMR